MKVGLNEIRQSLGRAAQSLHNWELKIIKPPKGVQIPKEFLLRVQSAGLPVATTEYANVDLGGHSFTGASKTARNGEINLVALEGIDAKTQEIFKQLENLSWNFTNSDVFGNQTPIADQKMEVAMNLMSGLDNTVTKTYNFSGALFHMTDRGQLGQDLALQQIAFSMRYDYFLES